VLLIDSTNVWLLPRGLPTLMPVDSVEGLWGAITAGKNENKRPVLHNSDTAAMSWPWKIVTGTQVYASWTGKGVYNLLIESVKSLLIEYVNR
jgi:hypothetical protein